MDGLFSRRDCLKIVSAQCLAATSALPGLQAAPLLGRNRIPGWVSGHMTGAEALVETLLQEGTDCVYGIPGAQLNELWDTMKSKHLNYLLCTHEFSAAGMADGYARSTGKPGVVCVVPGPGLTNALTGIGEALLDSIPMVCLVGDMNNGPHARPFQVHSLPQVGLLEQVTKRVFPVQDSCDIPCALRQAFQLARAGEPGPVGVTIPYNLLIETRLYRSGPLEPLPVPFDEQAFGRALALLSNPRLRVGIYAGQGCMDYSQSLVRLAEVLQAPVATSMSGKGVIPENHPLSVGWGYGPQGTRSAEHLFKSVDLVLALGVRFSEVSTGFYSLPPARQLVHVDINQDNLGRVMRTSVCVHADAGLFLNQALENADCLRRPVQSSLLNLIAQRKCEERRANEQIYCQNCVDPMAFLLTLNRCAAEDALTFVDVTVSQYWATEVFQVQGPRLFFNPTNNQSMGWSIPAALGAQRIHGNRQTLAITGDGCFLMSGMEISTAARENLPVKFFVLDDQAYRYMQELQRPAYMRTTATILARLDYRALARGWGVSYLEIQNNADLEPGIRAALDHPGPILTRLVTQYNRRPIRWLRAARARYTKELTPEQKIRFLARAGSRALDPLPEND